MESGEGRAAPQTDEPGAPQDGAPDTSWFGRVTQALNIVGTVLILMMVVAVNADVIGRDAFNHPIPGVLEFLGLSIVAIVFLQMANTLREGRHVSNDLIVQALSAWVPRLEPAFYALFHLLGALLMGMIAVYVWPIFKQNYDNGYFRGTAAIVEIPIWPFQAAILIGAVATMIQFLILAWGHARRTVAPRPRR